MKEQTRGPRRRDWSHGQIGCSAQHEILKNAWELLAFTIGPRSTGHENGKQPVSCYQATRTSGHAECYCGALGVFKKRETASASQRHDGATASSKSAGRTGKQQQTILMYGAKWRLNSLYSEHWQHSSFSSPLCFQRAHLSDSNSPSSPSFGASCY